MKVYLQRANANDEFMKHQEMSYQIGKRHLANIMGEEPETFTQEKIDVGIMTYFILFFLYTLLDEVCFIECYQIFIP